MGFDNVTAARCLAASQFQGRQRPGRRQGRRSYDPTRCSKPAAADGRAACTTNTATGEGAAAGPDLGPPSAPQHSAAERQQTNRAGLPPSPAPPLAAVKLRRRPSAALKTGEGGERRAPGSVPAAGAPTSAPVFGGRGGARDVTAASGGRIEAASCAAASQETRARSSGDRSPVADREVAWRLRTIYTAAWRIDGVRVACGGC
jgi:hypothetical protein